MTSPPGAGKPPCAARHGPALRVSDWDDINGAELPVRLRIPFASEWRHAETRTALRLEHPRERVRIVVRLWPASRLVSEHECLAQLGLLDPEFARTKAKTQAQGVDPEAELKAAVVSTPFDPAPDFRGHLQTQVASASADGPPRATVVAVAAASGRCLAFVAAAAGSEPSTAEDLGERLAWIENIAASLSVRSSEERIEKAPLPIR